MTHRTPLTAAEQETIIRFDDTNAPASVFTYNKRWQQHIEGKLGIKPTFKNSRGGKDYEVPKKAIRLPLIIRRTVTPQQRARSQVHLAAARAAKHAKTATQRTPESTLATAEAPRGDS